MSAHRPVQQVEAARVPCVVCSSRRGYFAELETPAPQPEMRVWLLLLPVTTLEGGFTYI